MIICISYHDEKSDAFIILVTTPVITGNKQRKTLIISHGKKLAYKSQDIPHYMTVERRKCWSIVWQQKNCTIQKVIIITEKQLNSEYYLSLPHAHISSN